MLARDRSPACPAPPPVDDHDPLSAHHGEQAVPDDGAQLARALLEVFVARGEVRIDECCMLVFAELLHRRPAQPSLFLTKCGLTQLQAAVVQHHQCPVIAHS